MEDDNMKEFEVTLTAVSSKTFKLRADSQEDAFLLAEAILENTLNCKTRCNLSRSGLRP